jgi:hypothetical protein
MKPFNLKDALAGKPCLSKCGDKGKVIDIIVLEKSKIQTEKLVVTFENGESFFYGEDGQYFVDRISAYDLVMESVEVNGFINLYPCQFGEGFATGHHEPIFYTEASAKQYGIDKYGTLNFITIAVKFEK